MDTSAVRWPVRCLARTPIDGQQSCHARPGHIGRIVIHRALDRDPSHRSGAPVTATIASLSHLRILSGLSVGIEVDFIYAGLPLEPWLCVPCVRTQLDSAEFLYREATPYTLAFWRQATGHYCCLLQTDSTTRAVGLTSGPPT